MEKEMGKWWRREKRGEKCERLRKKGAEENRGRIRNRMEEEEAKLRGLAASFHQTDSRLELLLRRTVCIQLHKSPYACAPCVCVSLCVRVCVGLLLKSATELTADVSGAGTRVDDNAESKA